MRLEISKEQFDSIQTEIIRIEEYLSDNRDTMDTWDFVFESEHLDRLKEILKTEVIDLNQLQ